MRMTFFRADRTPALAGALLLALTACLSGCASKNPLIDDATPAASAKPAEPSAQTAVATAPANGTNTANSGVTTTEPTRMQRFLGILSPYRIDVQQGNFVSREMVSQLEESMQRPEGVTREQVRFVLGTPLLNDIFHADRWDYVFRLKKRSGEVISSRVTAYFKDNRLARIDGGTLPTEKEYLAFIAGSTASK